MKICWYMNLRIYSSYLQYVSVKITSKIDNKCDNAMCVNDIWRGHLNECIHIDTNNAFIRQLFIIEWIIDLQKVKVHFQWNRQLFMAYAFLVV